MSAGGSSAQSAAGSRSFGYDDLLCSFEDCTLQLDPTANGKRFDSSVKDLHGSRAMRPSATVNGRPEEFLIDDVVYTVEKCMKKHADNLTMHLEGISGRLTQLELYCYKLERSICEFRTDMIHDQSEAYLKLKSLDKHVHEVHRSVQIIRDKQELYETQIELTKLQVSQNEDLNAATSKNKANFEINDVPNQKLTLGLPDSSSSPPSVAISPVKNHPEKELPVQHHVLNQVNEYYYAHHHQPLIMEQHSQNLQSELHYTQQRVKMHDLSVQEPPKQEQHVAANQFTQKPPFPQYQQHWSQPMQPQQPSSQAQSPRIQTPPAYAPYAPNQLANKIPESHHGSSTLLPALYSTAPQSEILGGSRNTISHLPPQHNMQQQQASQGSFAPPPLTHCGYVGTSTYPSQSNMLGYNAVYVINGNVAASLISSNHPYGAVVEKAVSMRYPTDQMVGIVLGTAESG